MSDFAHRLPLDQIRDGDRLDLVADEAEAAAVGGAAGPDVARPAGGACRAVARRPSEFRATGRLKAALEQACVATGEPVPAHVDEAFEILFVPEPKAGRPDEEIELGADDLDTMFHDGSAIDLGGAIADTLALALDPYPRSAGAEAALKEAGVLERGGSRPVRRAGRAQGEAGPGTQPRLAILKTERRRPGRCRTPPAAGAAAAWTRRRQSCRRTAAAAVVAIAATAAKAAARAAFAAVEQDQLAAETLQDDFGGVAVIARLVLPFAGLDLAFEIDLAALPQIAFGDACRGSR